MLNSWRWKEVWHGNQDQQITSNKSIIVNKLGNKKLKRVDHFKYLGSVLTRYG